MIQGILRASALVLVLAPPAAAIVFDVDTTADAPDAALDGVCADAAGLCTLRAAVQEANDSVEADEINLPAGRYKLSRTGDDEEVAATGDLDVLADLTIRGAGVGLTVVQAKKDRSFQVFPGATVTISDLTIQKGKLGKKGDVGDEFGGGGVFNQGVLTLERVLLTKNKVSDDGAGVENDGGTLTLVDVVFEKNKAGDDAGALDVDGGTRSSPT